AWIVVRDRSAALLPDVQALAGERELGRLGSDPPLTDGLVADVERQGALRRSGISFLLERRGEDDTAEWDIFGRLDHLLLEANVVVDVLELAVLDVQRVATEARPLGEEHTARLLGVDCHLDSDGVRAVPDVRRDRLGYLRAAGVIDVALARLRQLRPLGEDDLDRVACLERKRVIATGLGPPERDQLLQRLRVLIGEVVAFARVVLGVE